MKLGRVSRKVIEEIVTLRFDKFERANVLPWNQSIFSRTEILDAVRINGSDTVTLNPIATSDLLGA